MRHANLKEKMGRWQMLQDNLRPMLAELPHLTAELDVLEGFLAGGRELEAQQGVHKAAIRETNRKRGELEKAGGEAYTRIVLALRAQLGPKSERLLTFGVEPQKTVRRRTGINASGAGGAGPGPAAAAVSRSSPLPPT